MKITLDRDHKDGELSFTIRVSECKKISDQDIEMLDELEACVTKLNCPAWDESSFKKKIVEDLNDVKYEIHDLIIRTLKFEIQNCLQNRYNHVMQEIYNWIYDNQNLRIQSLMNSLEPCRTTYYFDNDEHATKNNVPQESEHDDEDEDDDSEWEDDDE